MMQITRIRSNFDQLDDLLALIRSSFAYMDGRIDPPSSAHLLTLESLRQKIVEEIAFVATDGGTLAGCIFCRPEEECLYIGKLAVAPDAQGRGLGMALLEQAQKTALGMDLQRLRLETRIELTENHARFSAWGFVRTKENAHTGYDRITSIEMTKTLS